MRMAHLILVVAIIGCRPSSDVARHTPSRSELAAVDARTILGKSEISFMSWGGEWQGSDTDTVLTFLPDGTVQVAHFGSGVDTVTGRYETDGDEITIEAAWEKLVEMPGAEDFPSLVLRRDADTLYLFPSRETESLQYGDHSAWPLKQTTSKIETQTVPEAGGES